MREGALRARVAVPADPFRIGRDSSACDLLVDDPRVSPVHARLRYRKGEWMLSAESDGPVAVNGRRAPLLPLRSGDLVCLTPPGDMRPICLRFENRMESAFVPPDTSLGTIWLSFLASPGTPPSERWLRAIEGGPAPGPRRIEDPEGGPPLLVEVLGPVRDAAQADRHLRTLAALAGAPHPDCVFVVDGGIAPGPDGVVRWIAWREEDGTVLEDLLARGRPPPRVGLRILQALARAVAHVERRHVVHGHVSPANVVARTQGGAALFGFGRDVDSPDAAVDLSGLVAVARAVLGDVPPEPLEGVLGDFRGVSPSERPGADALERAFAFAEASLAAGASP